MRTLLILTFLAVTLLTIAQNEISQEDYNQATEAYNQATDFFYNKAYDQALPLVKFAITMNNGNADYWFLKSNIESRKKQLDSALYSIQTALDLAPDQSDYLLQKANTLFKLKQFEKAAASYSSTLQNQYTSDIPVNEGHVLFNRGNCWLNLKKYAEAKSDFDLAIDEGYEVAMVYHNRATAALRLGNKSDACKDFRKAVELESPISQKYVDKYCQ